MTPTLTPLKQPIALRTEYITSHPTTIRVKQHSNSWSGGDFTITKCPTHDSPLAEKLFTVDGDFKSMSQRRHFQDASGLPLFEISHKRLGVTWFVHLPGGKENTSSSPIATIVPQWHALKGKFDVHLHNAAADGEETVLETHVYYKGALVTAIKLKDMVSVYIPGKGPTWELEVAEGMDLSLAAIIGVVLATVLYQSSYKGTAPKSTESDPGPGVGSSGKELAP
ncbi:tubby C-terminal-like domain-containing protein [Aspergillus transmontanensis]|uniref:Tubby C-terminal-like domain-containing protein n=1 Tax=Aspergillus transmontanensis TaxID=1034304 RepID=A0A5N6VGG9_9EURO|nr:tubby C-terminal-like domain-containing protein [Aspergillus transmontanensis]